MKQNDPNRKPTQSKASHLAHGSRRNSRVGVLHLCPDLHYGDPARETVTLAVLTQRLGWRAMIASNGGALVTEAERAAVKHIRMPLHSNGMFANWRNRVHLEALIQRERPAILHAHGLATVEMACKLNLQHKLPLVIDLTQPLPTTPATHKLIAKMAQTSCTIRVPSRTMIEHLTSTFQINPAMIVRLAPGVDLQSYNPAAISAERLHNLSRLWRLPEQAIVALVSMPLEPHMGHAEFLLAMSQIKEENVYAIMVGSDRHAPGLRAELEQSVDRLGLNGKVIMPEVCTDWPAAFWLANVVIAANSIPRGQNMEIIGAQALGRPVIVTASGANEEMVLKGETAWVLPPENPAALAKALREAARMNTDQRVNLAENTRFFVEENFPQANWFNGMMELYEAAMQPNTRKTRVA